MRIDDNAEALAMMKRALGSLEAKIREAYNKGYTDGVKSMVAEDEPKTCETCGTPRPLCEYCIEEDRMWTPKTEPQTEPNCSEKPNNSTISKMEQVDKDINVRSEDEPQTETSTNSEKVQLTDEPQADDLIKQADALIAFEKEWLEMDEPQTEREGE